MQEYGEFVNCNREDLLEFEIGQLKAERDALLAERDELRDHHTASIIEIGKMCGEDLTDEPRFKWAALAVSSVVSERDKMKAEREAMIKQKPVRYYHTNSGIDSCLYTWDEIKDGFPSKFTALYERPVQEINPFPVLSSNDSVPMPANADQAAAMAILGEAWLKHNAPERLKVQQTLTRELWMKVVEDAFHDGFNSPNTYNDVVYNNAKEEWEKFKVDYQFPQLPAQQINILDMGMDQPASMRRCVQKLIEAAGILLDDKNYDGTGHELISDARNNAIKYLADHNPAQQIPEGYAIVPIEPTKMMAEAMEYEAAGFDFPEPYWQNILAAASASQPKGDV